MEDWTGLYHCADTECARTTQYILNSKWMNLIIIGRVNNVFHIQFNFNVLDMDGWMDGLWWLYSWCGKTTFPFLLPQQIIM